MLCAYFNHASAKQEAVWFSGTGLGFGRLGFSSLPLGFFFLGGGGTVIFKLFVSGAQAGTNYGIS